MKKFFLIVLLIIISTFTYAQNNYSLKNLYDGGIYGQTFKLDEFKNKNGIMLRLFMCDNKTSITKNYDSDLPTVICIFSNFIEDQDVYLDTVDECKYFFDISMDYVYLADMKDICDICPSCEFSNYEIIENNDKGKCIYIAYDCYDFELLFEIASQYTMKGRAFVLEKYIRNKND